MAYIGNQPLATAVTNADISSSAAIDLSKLATSGDLSATNVTLGGYLRGPSTFTIDPAAHGDNTGTLVIAGNLQVDGTQTVVNSTTMEVDDLNITVASGAANAAAADGAGITVDGASATFTYANTGDKWTMNKPLDVSGIATSTAVTTTNSGITLQSNGVTKSAISVAASTNHGITGTSAGDQYNWTTGGKMIWSTNNGTNAHLLLDSNGTLAVGTTDTHTWTAFDGRLRVGARGCLATTTASTQVIHNAYFDGAYKRIGGTDYATRYYQTDGTHVWDTAASGAADSTISFSEAMRIKADGRLDLAKGMVDTTTTVSYASSIALTLDNGAIQTVTLTGNVTFTDSLNDGEAIVLMLNGGASHTVTWTAVTKWVTGSGNAAPTLTASDAIILWKIGSSVYAATAGSFA